MKKSFEQFNKRNIDYDEGKEKPFEKGEEPKKQEKFSEELKEYQKKGQEMIDSYRNFFMTYARDVSLSFKMSDGFYINLENGEVNLDTKWFMEKSFSKDQILWANLHELSHFIDLVQDPKDMMKNFDYIEEQARETGKIMMKKWEEKYGKSDPEFIENLKKQKPINKKNPKKTMNAVEQVAYQIYHTFYNIFDDIYVNNLISIKAPKYEKSQNGEKEVKKLYAEKLFTKTDYSKLPRHLQFVYKLIREEMVPDQEVKLTDEVADVIKRKIKFLDKEYTPKEIVEKFIKPNKLKGSSYIKAGDRYFVLRNTLEPIFKELLAKDLVEWEPKKQKPQEDNGESQEGSVNPFNQNYQEYKQNNPDQIDSEEIKNWLDKYEEEKKKEEEQKAKENKSVDEKAKEAQEKMDNEWRKKHNINPGTLRQYRKIETEVAPYLGDLSRLWQRIIWGSTKKIERGIEGYFKTGTELDIGKVIEEWPKIEKGKLEETRVMKKMTQKEVLIRKPELIRVRLVGDMSGSMNNEKLHTLQQCFVLLLSSLREFNTYLNLTRSQTKSKLEIDTEAWIFGSYAEKVKTLRSESNYDDEQVEIIKIFEKLQNTIGDTYDSKALEAIFNSLTPKDKEKIGQEKIMEMVLEITDGGSSESNAARKAVDKLSEVGVITRAFQIGIISDEEKKIFNYVWNKNREEKFGEIVGKKIENLLPAITELLKKYLGNVRL